MANSFFFIQWQRGGIPDGENRVNGRLEFSTDKCLDWLRTLCFLSKLLLPDSLLLVAAGCGLCVSLPALTAIENSRQGTLFPNNRHEHEKPIYETHVSTPSVDEKRDI